MDIKPLPEKLLLHGGTILDPKAQRSFTGDVLIIDGKIAEIGSVGSNTDSTKIDCSGLIITAGFCDLHVHFREPGREDKETLASGSRAALAGGFTRVCVMPNTSPPIDTPEMVGNIIDKAADLPVHIHPIGAVTQQQKGFELTEMGGLLETGAVAFSDDGLPISNGSVMRMALEYAGMFDVPVINHAEDLTLRNDGLMNEGRVSTQLGLPGNPALSEITMVHRDLELAVLTGSKLHVPHVSTAGAADLIRRLKAKSQNITAEVTPHHLFFNDEALKSFDTNLKVAPPLRSETDRQGLIQAVLDGVFDCIATDHAPHTIEEKEGTFDLAPFGMIGLESCFGAVNRVLVREAGLSLEKLVQLLTVQPRRIMGFDDDLLQVGKKAELTIFDPDLKYTFQVSDIHSKSANSPYVGHQLIGKARITINKGIIAKNH
ncbi:MAG: dihydroorotase [Candidatus Marinimicrobia bacterium]|nr:dihydroorotase [Candidatus Neomarinimicrobiota bacterium]